MNKDSSTEQKMRQAYSFEKETFEVAVEGVQRRFCPRESGRSIHEDGSRTEKAREPRVESH